MTRTAQPPSSTQDRTVVSSVAIVLIIALLFTLVVVGAMGVAVADTPDSSSNSSSSQSVSQSDESGASKDQHPNVEDSLLVSDGPPRGGTQQSADGSVTVIVEAADGAADGAEAASTEHGEVLSRHRNLLKIKLPRENIEPLANEDAVRFVRRPIRPQQTGDYSSEGVETTRADLAQTRGWTGNESTVAVIDSDVDPTHDPIADNVVHTNDTTGEGFNVRDTTHGDASAEIVTDVAPDTNLVLIKIGSYFDAVQVADYIENNDWGENGTHLDIDVVSMSLAFYLTPNDGTARLDQDIDASVANGTMWSIAAGNKGDGTHWNGSYNGSDGDSVHDFGNEGDECNRVDGPVSVLLQWNDWYNSDQDYDLRLYKNNSTEVVHSSKNVQDGSQPPYEYVQTAISGTYCFSIINYDADGSAHFDVFVLEDRRTMEHWTETQSITVPATGESATAVGAVSYDDRALRSYSSQGPTIDGRNKPDFVGPDGVSSAAYHPERYFGTSAAAPHVAGVAALVLAANDSVNAIGVNDRLAETSDSLGAETPNEEIGAGLVEAAAALPPQNPTSTQPPFIIDTDTKDAVKIDVSFEQTPKAGSVDVALTDQNGTTVTNTAALNTDRRVTSVTVNASQLANGDIEVAASATDTYGWRNTDDFTATSTTQKTDKAITVQGQLKRADGAAAADDTVAVFVSNDTGYNVVRTDSTGAFSLRLPQREAAYSIGYYQANRTQDASNWFPSDGTVDIFTTEVPGTQNTDLGTVTLSQGHNVTVEVRNESDVAVENASLYWFDREMGSKTVGGYSFSTNANGVAEADGVVFEALELNGSATVRATPPVGDDRFVNQDYRENLTVSGPETVTITLEEQATGADYANDQDVVDTVKLREAIDDWRSGDIGTDLLREIIDYWRSGEPVG